VVARSTHDVYVHHATVLVRSPLGFSALLGVVGEDHDDLAVGVVVVGGSTGGDPYV